MNGDNENQKNNSTYFDYEVKIEIDGDSPYMEMSHPHLSMAAYFLVRINGGDPFVFSRGGEEVSFLEKNTLSSSKIFTSSFFT